VLRRGIRESLRVCASLALAFQLVVAPALAAPMPTAPAATAPYDPLFDEEWDDEDLVAGNAFADPWEDANRRTHEFNRNLDRWILRPVTDAYAENIPDRTKLSVLNFFNNLSEPSTFLNDLLQREWDDAAIAFSRFLLNTTIGVAGLFDPAGAVFDMSGHNSDFGQTLALAGVPSGPYLVLPVMGPNNLRDSTGLIVDLFLRPTFWLLGPAEYIIYTSLQGTGHGIALREQHARSINALEDSSIDFYSSLHNAYGQSREASIWQRRESHR
jgi:phospholipid-binding lipoprotein MlaA